VPPGQTAGAGGYRQVPHFAPGVFLKLRSRHGQQAPTRGRRRSFSPTEPPWRQAARRHSCSPTEPPGGNTAPDSVELQFDVRVLPCQGEQEVLRLLNGAIGNLGGNVDVVSAHCDPPSSSGWGGPLSREVARKLRFELGASDYVVLGDNAEVLPALPEGSFQLIYIDPPFNTGREQVRRTLKAKATDGPGRSGFGGRSYQTEETARSAYLDRFGDYLGFLASRLQHARRLLSPDGTLYFHIDYREAHYCKLLLDEIFGRQCFLNEVIWAYDFGGRPKRRWPPKHDTILVYVRDPAAYYFDQDAVERIPYMAPTLVTPEKALRGKAPTDVWWHTIVPTSGTEKTGYPSQKPEAILRRVVQASSAPGSWVLDFFAGSGTTGAVARKLGRRFFLVDSNPLAVEVMRRRLGTDRVSYLTAAGEVLGAT
jgi:site-specific DNA-methyltransferase (adenine-specific)